MKIYDHQLIVITGGVGFIGSALTRYLNDLGIRNIVLVDELGTTEKWKNLLGKNIIDIIDKSKLFTWLEGKESLIEAIIHLGACSSTTETNASYLLENNYRYSIRLAEYALKADIRFIYASSAATYGDGSQGFTDDIERIEKLRPLNMYGMSKQLFDLWAKNEGVLNRVSGLKFFNVFGPNEFHKGRMASAVFHMYRSILNENVIRLFKSNDPKNYGDGEQKRDFIYVKDVAAIIHAFLTSDAMGIYNVGSGKANTWNSLALATFNALQLSPNIEYIPMPQDLNDKYQNYTCADMRKTLHAIKKLPLSLSLDEAVADYVINYLVPGQIW